MTYGLRYIAQRTEDGRVTPARTVHVSSSRGIYCRLILLNRPNHRLHISQRRVGMETTSGRQNIDAVLKGFQRASPNDGGEGIPQERCDGADSGHGHPVADD